MPPAQSTVTTQSASVTRAMREIHSLAATSKQHVRSTYFGHILTSTILAPPYTTIYIDPCNPSPCGSNAVCEARQKAGACRCIPEYFGDPYVACRPECVVNSDCPSNKACQRNKCIDPCPGTCGVNARCTVMNHIPVCTCVENYIGDPFTSCRVKPIRKFGILCSTVA